MHVISGADMKELARLLEGMADPTRLRLLRLLQGREVCVCELVDALGMPQYAVSRHLQQLRAMGLAEARREGRWMHYRLGMRAVRPGPARDLMAALLRHLDGAPQGKQDDRNLAARLARGRTGRCVMRSA
jgi:ArsR family transcriptional regulator